MRTETSERWIRGWVDDKPIVDTRAALLFWVEDFPVPTYAIDWADTAREAFRPTDRPSSRHRFYGPHSEVSQWFDVVVGERTLKHAAWTLADLPERVVVSWQPGVLDRWTEEDEEVIEHPRDPHARVDALPSSRRIRVLDGDTVLAESTRPVLLFETGLPVRYYLPTEDVDLRLFTSSPTRSRCPYKGATTAYWSRPELPNIAWCYGDPFPAVGAIAGRVAFYNELVDVEIDGVRQERAVSPFSQPAFRPSSG